MQLPIVPCVERSIQPSIMRDGVGPPDGWISLAGFQLLGSNSCRIERMVLSGVWQRKISRAPASGLLASRVTSHRSVDGGGPILRKYHVTIDGIEHARQRAADDVVAGLERDTFGLTPCCADAFD